MSLSPELQGYRSQVLAYLRDFINSAHYDHIPPEGQAFFNKVAAEVTLATTDVELMRRVTEHNQMIVHMMLSGRML